MVFDFILQYNKHVKYEIEQGRIENALCPPVIGCVLYSKVLPAGHIQYWREKKFKK